MSVVIDPQILGVTEDGSPSGAVRTVRSDGVGAWVSVRESDYIIENTGSTASFVQSGLDYNPDGSGQGIQIIVPATIGNGVRLWLPFSGRIFGVRHRLRYTDTDLFSVVVDGVAVPVSSRPDRMVGEGLTLNSLNAQAVSITHDNLDPTKPHTAEIIVPADLVTSTERKLVVFGWVLDRQFGYTDPRRIDFMAVTPEAVPTSLTVMPNGSTAGNLKGIRQIRYYNGDASARDVTVNYGAGTTFWKVSLAAGATAELTFPELVTINSNWRHQASGTGVIYCMIGGF